MRVELAYGRQWLPVELPDGITDVVTPRFVEGLPDEEQALKEALRNPIGSRPVKELVKPGDRVAIVFCDGTRPMPSSRVLPPLLAELETVPNVDIVLINALGTHRRNTEEELDRILGPEIARKYEVVQSYIGEEDAYVKVGVAKAGYDVKLRKEYVEADVRIVTGFIEPHFFAGFSGGPKLVAPGVASGDTIMNLHSAELIGHPRSVWGLSYREGNPLSQALLEVAKMCPPAFSLNVTLNRKHEITGVFAGDLEEAHQVGIDFVRKTAMQEVPEPYDIVITTNSGYPLDQNLYQTVKGMSAAARIVKEGGVIIAAAECSDGYPNHGNYRDILLDSPSMCHFLEHVKEEKYNITDRWQVQIQAMVQVKADVYLYTHGLTDEEVKAAHLKPCHDISALVRELVDERGGSARICVLPEGPMTIPYVKE
ncbi:MAG TPA: nickel-dependent lactate racemase [Firmicutes bacterium]|nr:nickel-dependent lactate racemase [Bacillota bacterium]